MFMSLVYSTFAAAQRTLLVTPSINGESNSRLGTVGKRRQKVTALCLEKKLAIQPFRTRRQLQRADRPTGAFSV